jgi:serpin B
MLNSRQLKLRASLLAFAACSVAPLAYTQTPLDMKLAPLASEPVVVMPANAATLTGVVKKDVVLDGAAKPNMVQPLPIPAHEVVTEVVSVASEKAVTSALADLGLALLRGQSAVTGRGQVNTVVSPLSLASALGLAQAGAAGESAREIALLLSAAPSVNRIYSRDYPALLKKINSSNTQLTMVNRVWVDQLIAQKMEPAYAKVVQSRFASEGSAIDFSKSDVARNTINAWAAKQTDGRVTDLLPAGALTNQTRLVLTNAVYFKSLWQQPFDTSSTVTKPFFSVPKVSQDVPTMRQTMQVKTGLVGNVSVLELPFSGQDYSLLIAMPPEGHTLNAFETDLSGSDVMQWSAQIKPANCQVELPKFTIQPKSVPLKATLQALGVQTVFDTHADFSPMLGVKGKDIAMDNVYQSAGVTVDERGGEAVAATAVVAVSKSMARTQPLVDCVVNRPFLFAIIHRNSGAPIFMGKIANPSTK